ncbi:hypothetical protein SAMN05444287_1620 [Octadecabacter temperatus]|uniref:Uncharacterized protein n=1 Tax=Octadecabacter temperatus TaxID=1458307 RepID=A0A0K0Y6A8_9RHOB|nr:hypothetical protein [Octadecabacter temperatus]AKS46504.1 hypothetical protein OSB_19640 [Octadecabacter temperatus]SIO15375.1 hypothetical protein SAMN05444287_1620 [Octadecabacter temperatus]
MTAQPQISEFTNPRTSTLKQPVFMRANVTEHFWGFEVRPNEHVFDVAVLMRAMTGFFAGTAFIAALGVWLLPSMAFATAAFSSKLIVSGLLMFATVMLARVAARGTQVRVQFDTSTGELREVVDGAFGGRLVLATHGLDAVEAVQVVESRENRGFGQVQIRVKGAGAISAGDGAVSALAVLRDRIASDCGLEASGPVREAVWGGPLVA